MIDLFTNICAYPVENSLCYTRSVTIGQMSALALRSNLGWTQAQLARVIETTERTVRRIEKGLTYPQADTQRRLLLAVRKLLPADTLPEVSMHVINPRSMEYYLGRAHGWQHWTRTERAQFRRWRLWYRRVLADQAAGRCVLEYVPRCRRVRPRT
jgi:transcriptional regulator with XRE-family HTH domain